MKYPLKLPKVERLPSIDCPGAGSRVDVSDTMKGKKGLDSLVEEIGRM